MNKISEPSYGFPISSLKISLAYLTGIWALVSDETTTRFKRRRSKNTIADKCDNLSGEEIHNRIMRNVLKVILCDPDKLSLSIIMELKRDLAELNDDKLAPTIKDTDRFNNDEEFMLNEFEDKL